MYKSILLATDGSKHAKRAAEAAAGLAASCGASLTVVSVAAPGLSLDELERNPRARRFSKAAKADMKQLRGLLHSAEFGNESPFITAPAPASALLALAEDIIEEATAVARRKSVAKVAGSPQIGDAAGEILAAAKRAKADLIVMGTRGLSDLGGLFLGSVSHKVIHLADCACLTVK